MAEIALSQLADLTFASGAIASITSACMLQAGGRAGFDLSLVDQVLRLQGDTLVVEGPDGSETFATTNDPSLSEDTAFVEAVASGDPSGIRSDYADAVRTLKLTLAATQSTIEGRIVEL